MNANYTLLDILTNNIISFNPITNTNEKIEVSNGIEIPMIQRDYVQVIKDEKTQIILQKFLRDIHSVLKSNQELGNDFLNLDFIYGYIENKTFIPLDGQQRLTTLYIIHWFLAFKDERNFKSFGLQLFNYKTRQSSKEFLKSLNTEKNQFKIRNECDGKLENLIYTIQNQPWYDLKWDLDPTVKGILQTLEDVISVFSDINFEVIISKKPLNFHFLKIDEFGLGDNLYIKMNARGKPLSEFENFKASFENIIPLKNETSEKFIKRIDGKWLDAFWSYSLAMTPSIEIESNVEDVSNKCDSILLNFIKKVTEYLFYKNNIGDNFRFSIENIEKIYSNEESLSILNKLFDLISSDNFKWNEYFDDIFTERWASHKIATNQVSNNFIKKIFEGEPFQHFDNLLFFGWLDFILRQNSTSITSDLLDFLRIIRNYINNINQKKKTSLNTELRTDYYSIIINLIQNISTVNPYESLGSISNVFRKEYINYEIEKHKLFKDDLVIKESVFKFEDHSTLRGLLFNFDLIGYDSAEISSIVDNFYNLFKEVQYQDIIRLLLCFGNYSVKVGVSNLGDFRYFGNEREWHRVLASPEGEVKGNFVKLFPLFAKQKINDWNKVIEESIMTYSNQYKDNWLWYALQPKYKMLFDHPIHTLSHHNQVEIFHSPSLNSYHWNPFVFWLRYHSPNDCKKHINESASCAQYSNFSRLHLKNGLELEQNGNIWYVHNLEINFFHPKFKYDEISNCYFLECDNLIEEVIPFIELLNNIKTKNA
jgi:hypothetical protein